MTDPAEMTEVVEIAEVVGLVEVVELVEIEAHADAPTWPVVGAARAAYPTPWWVTRHGGVLWELDVGRSAGPTGWTLFAVDGDRIVSEHHDLAVLPEALRAAFAAILMEVLL